MTTPESNTPGKSPPEAITTATDDDTKMEENSVSEMSYISTPLPHPFPAALPPKAARRLMDPPKSGWPDATRKKLPPWDRIIDIVYHKYRRGEKPRDDDASHFAGSVALFFADHKRAQQKEPESSYLRLPAIVRYKICREIAAHHSAEMPISLTSRRATREVWKDDEFTSLKSALQPLQPYLDASFALRADMMVAFFSVERFHITYSPFVNTYFDPLATLWYSRYGHFMQQIVLELDMSRFGFGPGKQAHKLRGGSVNIDTLIQRFVEVQLKRCSSLESLILLCRRFYGQRPINPVPVDPVEAVAGEKVEVDKQVEADEEERYLAPQEAETEMYYCPDEALRICEPLVQLEGLIDSLRLCGFSNQYTHSLLRRLFSIPKDKQSLKQHTYRVAPSSIWPRLPGQLSWIDSEYGTIKLDDHSVEYLRGLYSPEGAIQLPPPYSDPLTGVTSICAPPVHTEDVSETSYSPERPDSRITTYGRSAKGSVASDAGSLEKSVHGLVCKIRRSMSRKEVDRESLGSRSLKRHSAKSSAFENMSAYSDGYRRGLRLVNKKFEVNSTTALVDVAASRASKDSQSSRNSQRSGK